MSSMVKGNTASIAGSFPSSFERIRLALVVSIYGGVPHETGDEKEILLDDVTSDGLILQDFGRQLPNKFIRKDTLKNTLGRPNTEIRALLAKLKAYKSRMRLKDNTSHYVIQVQRNPSVGKPDSLAWMQINSLNQFTITSITTYYLMH
jgi:division protein CdvB (Snf7/Vps24/ESCRT-III family)